MITFAGLVFLATLVSEDLTCIGVGFLIAREQIPLGLGIAACAFGLWLGDLLLYAAGRFGGASLGRFLRADVRGWEEKRLRQGSWAVLLSRVVPGARLPLYVGAGATAFPFLRFALLLGVGALLWTPVLVGASAWFGEMLLEHVDVLKERLLLSLILLAVIVVILTRVVPKLFHHRGRRLLRGRFERFRRWEFWPTWALYPPVLLWIAALAVRHRGLRIVTAANPGIEGGGLVGESKWRILNSLQCNEPGSVARTECVDWDRSAEQFERFRSATPGLPVVLKPDEGERGFGVSLLYSPEDLAAIRSGPRSEALFQEYVPGVEFGVFYLRFPSDSEGRIFSITEKRMLDVEGDGRRDLENLILDDPRAVCMAERHLECHRDRLHEVPAPGERVRLTELGTHSRGAVFLDGAPRLTEPLARRVDRVSRALSGFHFGRFDVRSPSAEAFSNGEFKVIELNGITSEATHMYDPRYGLLTAYRVLFEQWRLAFALGAGNIAGGARPASWGEIARLFRQRLARRALAAPPAPAARGGVL
jgi:membrane protein DedA with SNARE-associated domain